MLLPLARAGEASDEAICEALYVAAGFGQVIAARATLAGAEGGCQAEVGAASAMAAAALCYLKGGTPAACAAAAAMALGNLLGLVCDPVAGLVEVPCVKRNVVGAVNAVACANMALAGIDSAIPCDEVIDAMGRVGLQLSPTCGRPAWAAWPPPPPAGPSPAVWPPRPAGSEPAFPARSPSFRCLPVTRQIFFKKQLTNGPADGRIYLVPDRTQTERMRW